MAFLQPWLLSLLLVLVRGTPNAPATLVKTRYPKGLTYEKTVQIADETHMDPFDISNSTIPEHPFDMPAAAEGDEYQGSTTDKGTRQNFLHMTFAEQARFFSAVQSLKTEPHLPPFGHDITLDEGCKWNTWDWMSWKHNNISSYHTSITNGALFLPWHRMFLLYWEAQLERVSGFEDFKLPYWDYTNRWEAMKIFTDPLFGGNGTMPRHFVRNGQFSNWTCKVVKPGRLAQAQLTREFAISRDTNFPGQFVSSFGLNVSYAALENTVANSTAGRRNETGISPEQKQTGTLPSVCDYLTTLTTTLFFSGDAVCQPSMSAGLWQMHRAVHLFVGGDLNIVTANDPVFLLIHTFTDKAWLMWQKTNREGIAIPDAPSEEGVNTYGYPEGDIDTHLIWVSKTPRDVMFWEDLPYQYEWDDTLDAMYYKYTSTDARNGAMCKAFKQNALLRNYSQPLCHLST